MFITESRYIYIISNVVDVNFPLVLALDAETNLKKELDLENDVIVQSNACCEEQHVKKYIHLYI